MPEEHHVVGGILRVSGAHVELDQTRTALGVHDGQADPECLCRVLQSLGKLSHLLGTARAVALRSGCRGTVGRRPQAQLVLDGCHRLETVQGQPLDCPAQNVAARQRARCAVAPGEVCQAQAVTGAPGDLPQRLLSWLHEQLVTVASVPADRVQGGDHLVTGIERQEHARAGGMSAFGHGVEGCTRVCLATQRPVHVGEAQERKAHCISFGIAAKTRPTGGTGSSRV